MNKFQRQKSLFQESDQITIEDKEFIKQVYRMLERTGVTSQHSKEKRPRYLRTIIENEKDLIISKLSDISDQELRELNQKIADHIQDSKYKNGSGDYAQKTKTDMWRSWKDALEAQGLPAESHKDYMPKVRFTSDRAKVDTQADTKPEDLPTPDQMRSLLRAMEKSCKSKNVLRNQALLLVLWDCGLRWGEAIQMRMEDVKVKNGSVMLNVKGNKDAENRKQRVFQGSKTLKDFKETHPGSGKDKFFYNTYYDDTSRAISKQSVKRSLVKAKQKESLDFKTRGEPFHIFRKAYNTYYITNGIYNWSELCDSLGKKGNSTLPTYIKRSMEDVNAKAAEGFGIEEAEETGGPMLTQDALLPRNCSECGKLNKCFRKTCEYCEGVLQEIDTDADDMFESDDLEAEKVKSRAAMLMAKEDLEQSEAIEKVYKQMKAEGEL